MSYWEDNAEMQNEFFDNLNTVEKEAQEMSNTDLLMYEACEKHINLTYQCKTENGITNDEKFMIKDIIGDFELLTIVNQYGIEYKVNPNQVRK